MDREERERFIKGLQAKAVAADSTSDWFEDLYSAAQSGLCTVPWDDGEPNPHLGKWLVEDGQSGDGLRALEVGCGYGDAARTLSDRGYEVDAVDLSPAAIAMATARNAHPRIRFQVVDMLTPPKEFEGAFDLIVEVYTLQAIDKEKRAVLTKVLPKLLKPGGRMFVVCRARDEDQETTGPPWHLAPSELQALTTQEPALETIWLERFVDDETPAKERFRMLLKRPG